MSEKIKEVIKKRYTEAVTQDNGCGCDPGCCSPESEFTVSDSYANIEGYEKEADYNLGCGIPTEYARMSPGDTVLDLGSGAGNDVFVARRIVGESGRVIGVDMTEAMIAKANQNKQKLGYENVEFRLGEIEDLPVENGTIDVAISNCVMNLVPDKKRAFDELFRVVKSGGHFSISDIVLVGDLPKEIKNVAELYASCVSGALPKDEYLEVIKDAGFTNVQILKEKYYDLPDEILLQYISNEALTEYRKSNNSILSITVYGEKPL